MKTLITGAAGFIGSHVARLLVRKGWEVCAIVRDGGDRWRIADFAAQLRLVPGDLFAFEALRPRLAEIRPELCIHLAWYAVPGQYLHSLENLRCLTASLDLASELAGLGCRRLVSIGSCFEYDLSLGYLSEETPIRPGSLYAACKASLHLVLGELAASSGMSVAWPRPFYPYGPFEDQRRLVPSIICSLLQNRPPRVFGGEQVRDFLHVEDVASAICAVAESNLFGAVNIGSGEPVTLREMVTRIGVLLDRAGLLALGAEPPPPSDPMFVCANNRRLVENTAWTPRFDLEQGLQNTISWWRQRLR